MPKFDRRVCLYILLAGLIFLAGACATFWLLVGPSVVRVPSKDLDAILPDLGARLGIADMPAGSVIRGDVLHVRGSWVFGSVVAYRFEVDPDGVSIAPSTSQTRFAHESLVPTFDTVLSNAALGSIMTPSWVADLAGIGVHSSWQLGYFGDERNRSAPIQTVYGVSPDRREIAVVMACDVDHLTTVAPRWLIRELEDTRYIRIDEFGVGADWREWGRVRLVPISD